MKNSVRTAVAAGALVALAGLSACGSGGSSDAGSGSPQVITVWGPWSGDAEDQAAVMFDAYNASQDEYQVDYQPQEEIAQKVLTAIASGDVPDLVIWDRYQTSLYAAKGALMSVDDLIERDGVDTSVFYEQALSETQYDGQTYGLPLIVDDRVLFYNKTLFAEAGLEPPTTWAELEADAVALTVRDASGTLVQSGFELQDAGLFNLWCLQAGCDLVSEDSETTAFDSAAGLEVLDFWDRLLNQDKVYDLGFSDTGDPFAEGTLAMKYDGPWALSTYNDVEGLDYGIVEPPTGPDGDTGAIMGGLALVIPEGATNVDGAWDFSTWWTLDPANGVTFAQVSGWPPANTEAAADPYFASDDYAAFTATMEYAQARPTVPGYQDVEGLALTPQIEKFMSGEISAADALAAAAQQGDEILAEERG
ncbi:MAG TPA: ABC transporter substrate-binding protein [Cellulomonas sp.]